MSFFRRLLVWLDCDAPWSPDFAATAERYLALRNSAEWGSADYKPLVAAARKSGDRVTARKRKGNIVVIIDIPQKDGTKARLRLKFKEKA